ncbi:winged helix-turn-helix domain-containing protein [Natronorubrum halophilum]|uniref:winged helix-turn-helix domain-containing protein n=1 Tax=Natronorubrum halophilum TaxID=1702106 RepID=UPI0013CF2230|nr:winged helix-turn-helix domain-containing protein [Natronorubrum halophilum]
MTRFPEVDIFDALDNGDVIEYVEQQLFGGKIDTLERHIERKQALAEPTRYSILYLLFEYGKISRKRLATETGRDSNALQHHLEDLLETNLIAKIPAPEGADGRQTYYRITTLGKQEIASDIDHLVGGHAHEKRYKSLGDPELVDGMIGDGDRRRILVATDEGEAADLQNRWRDHRSQRNNFQQVAGQE